MTIRFGDDQLTFDALCRRVLSDAGGRSERNDLATLVLHELGSDGYRSATWPQFVSRVVAACRAHDQTGLPRAQSFDGEVVQRQLWTSDEYARSIRDRRRTVRVESAIIKRLRAECSARHGVELTIEGEVAA